MAQKGIKGNKHKYKGRNGSPSRDRYWAAGGPKRRKVANLMRDRGWSEAQATTHWLAVRQGRRIRPANKPTSLLAATT